MTGEQATNTSVILRFTAALGGGRWCAWCSGFWGPALGSSEVIGHHHHRVTDDPIQGNSLLVDRTGSVSEKLMHLGFRGA